MTNEKKKPVESNQPVKDLEQKEEVNEDLEEQFQVQNENLIMKEMFNLGNDQYYRLQLIGYLQRLMAVAEQIPTLMEIFMKTPKAIQELTRVLQESSSEEIKEENTPSDSEDEETGTEEAI